MSTASHSRRKRRSRRGRLLFAEHLEPRCLLDSAGAAGLLSFGDLTYGSGPLVQNIQIQPIYLKDSGTGKTAPASERTTLDSFFTKITSDSYIPSLLGQYSVPGQTIGTGTKGANDIDVPVNRDTSFTSVKNGNFFTAISDSNIRGVIANEIAHSRTGAVNANTVYFVFTPPGTPVVRIPGSPYDNSVDADASSWASYFTLNGKNVYYAVITDPNPPNYSLNNLGFGSLSMQQLTVAASHEIAEVITDPLRELVPNHGTGWYDRNLNQQVADLVEAQTYTQDGMAVQYEWSQQALGPAHAPGTPGNVNNLFINQLTPPAVDTFAGGPVATFTSTNPNLNASSFSAYVSFDGFEGLQPATVSGGNNGLYVISATPSAPLGDGQYGTTFPQETYLENGGMLVYVFDQADGGPSSNAPLSARYASYAVSVAASLIYNADAGGVGHDFRLVKNAGTGNFELYDSGNLVFKQPIAQTIDIQIGADPEVSSSLTLDFSGGAFGVPVTFDGGTGSGQHTLTVVNGTFAQESYSPSGPDSGTFGLDGQAVTVAHLTAANIPATLAVTTNSQTVLTGQSSGTITVELQDPFGNAVPATTGGIALHLDSSSAGGTFLNTSGQPLSGNLTIAQGSTTAAFKYKDTQIGTPTLTVSAATNQPVSLASAEYTLNIASFIVTTSSDEDNGTADPAMGSGTSLREAINAANLASGPDFIAFNIPGGGVHTIQPTSGLPLISGTVTIDGYTQPGASPNTLTVGDNATLLIEINGAAAGDNSGLVIRSQFTTVRGLVINGFSGAGGGASGIALVGATNAVIEGNFLGTDVTGSAAIANGEGIFALNSFTAGSPAVVVATIGDNSPAARNLISGNLNDGVDLKTNGTGSAHITVHGNLIGTAANGTAALGNGGNGVALRGIQFTSVAGNTIAFNAKDGVAISPYQFAPEAPLIQGDTNSVISNSIFKNGGLGIDLNDDGPTANDVATSDADTGPNKLQNFPVISYVTRDEGQLKVTYTVPTDAVNASFPIAVQFFEADADGQEGQIYLGADQFESTDVGTSRTALITPLASIAVGDKIVATATDVFGSGNTSEFSFPNVTLVSPWQNPGHLRWDVNDDTHVVADDVLAIINYINGTGSGPVPANAANKKLYYDVDGDDNVVASDVLNVINYINSGRPFGGEAEAVEQLDGEAVAAGRQAPSAEPLAADGQSPISSGQEPVASDVMTLLAADLAAQATRKRRF